MQLSELLSELRENILYDRTDLVAGTSDHLWSDATLVRYINEAERRFAREGLVLRDADNPAITRITLVAGQTDYELHDSILRVLSAKRTGDVGDLTYAGHDAFNGIQNPQVTVYDPSSFASLTPGQTLAFSVDERLTKDGNRSVGRVVLKVYPEPSADEAGDTIDLRVIRLPQRQLTTADMCAIPEIPEIHHLEMLDWAAYLALRIVDHDAGQSKRADEFAASFEAHAKKARLVANRKLYSPTKWNFGTGGFVWEQGHG